MPTLTPQADAGVMVRLAWLSLIHGLWIGLLIAAAVALLLHATPRITHRTRYAMLLVAMLAAALCPIAVAIAQHVVGLRADRPATPIHRTILVCLDETSGIAPSGPADPYPDKTGFDATRPARHFAFVRSLIARGAEGMRAARPVVTAAWAAIVAMMCTVLALGGLALRRICRQADAAPAALQERCRRLARLLRLRRIPIVLVHAGQAEPFLCGLSRPAVVLPRAWISAASPPCLDAILAHELAHARRLDHLVNLAQRLVEVGLCFHPAVHWLSRTVRRERELCADALAIRLTRDPLALAEALQSVARLRLASPRVPAVGPSPGGPSASLLPRIQELIGMTPPRPRFSPWPLAALPAAGLLALMAAAAGFAEGPPMSPVVEAPPVVKGTAAQGEPRPVDDDRQISYEVRYVDGPAERWRELLLPRIKQLRQEAELSAWIIDDAALRDLLVSSQQDPHTNVLSAPKLTAFHKTKASVMNRTKHFYVAGVEEVAAPRAGFSPQVKHVEAGVSLEMTGSIVPRGTHLSVEIVDDSVLGFHVIQRRKRVGEVVVAATYQIPTTANHRWNLDCEIPRGTQLLISLGVHDAPGSLPDAANLANGVLERVGLPAYHATPVTLERLVIITPRPIVLESEERRGVPRAAITNATDGSR